VAEVTLALGSNLGDRAANLRAAVEELTAAGFTRTAHSKVYETPPYPPGQPPFLNAIVRGDIELAPEDLLALCKRLERELGRTPTYRWGPRVIDIDILFYGDLAMETEALTIPHPRIAERAFVLVPLADVWDGPLPVLGRTAIELLERIDRDGISAFV
jgi:2-amino-4-hydroxy-6-hydroxymethyldihydropteridine diphosphokinase